MKNLETYEQFLKRINEDNSYEKKESLDDFESLEDFEFLEDALIEAKGPSSDLGLSAKKLKNLKVGDFAWRLMTRYNPQLGTYYTFGKQQIGKVTGKKIFTVNYYRSDEMKSYDIESGREVKHKEDIYGASWYSLLTHQEALENIKNDPDRYKSYADKVKKLTRKDIEEYFSTIKEGTITESINSDNYMDADLMASAIIKIDGSKIRAKAKEYEKVKKIPTDLFKKDNEAWESANKKRKEKQLEFSDAVLQTAAKILKDVGKNSTEIRNILSGANYWKDYQSELFDAIWNKI